MSLDVTSLQRFREQSGLTQQVLGDRIGVTRQTIAAWEKGERNLSVAQLARLAKALGVPLELLLGAASEPEATLLFRADDPAVLSPELRDLLSHRAEDYAAIERLAGEAPILPESRPISDFDPDLIERASSEARDWLGVDDAPLGNVDALLEAKGLKILLHPLPAGVSGFSAFTEAWGGVIVLNRDHALERQYFTALHELAHLIFHRREYDGPRPASKRRNDPREQAANHFAAAMLLPREAMLKELRAFKRGWIPEPVLEDMKLKYSVSMRTVLLRASALRLITRQQAGQHIGVLNKRFGRDNEQPELPLPERKAQSRLEWLTYRALINDAITTSRAAEVLATPLAQVRERLARYNADPALEGAPG